MTEKVLDPKGRWRNKIVGFRMSPEEVDELDLRVKLCGLSKQDYLINAALNNKIEAIGNPLMMITFKKTLLEIEKELKRVDVLGELDQEVLVSIRTMREILEAFAKNNGKGEEDGSFKK